MKRTHQSLIRNARGQVALFVALIFQVLFVFFAMIVNVGLVVHHKINLQNSVDLAAYYGAMKQAEMFNAIAHVNYQIRQSWKLLTFRYQQLGTAGVASTRNAGTVHPPFSSVAHSILSAEDSPVRYDTYFCLPYSPFDLVKERAKGDEESYCREPNTLTVPLPGKPGFSWPGGAANPFVAFQTAINQYAEAAQAAAQNYCRYATGTNWMQLAKFIAAYKADIRNRKKLLLALANEISKEDPLDIQGESIRKGVYQTLKRNLTRPNLESLKSKFGENGAGSSAKEVDFKFVNSLSIGNCGGGSATEPPGWLKEILIYPLYAAFDGKCGSGAQIQFVPTFLNNGSIAVSPNIPPQLTALAQELAAVISDAPAGNMEQQLLRSSVGFEKDPWCVGYVGVSATTTPKIPFSPLGAVTMKATAFAKPFGGRIGPWYGTKWDRSASQSSDNPRTDALIPVRVKMTQDVGIVSQSQLDELKAQKRLFPNHSRYLGDVVGVLSELTVGQFHRAIHQKFPTIFLSWYNHIQDQDFDVKTDQGDILAWDKSTNQSVPMRELEIAAIAPDQFDISTYSIDPDFYNNYITKIQKGYGNKLQFLIRGDLGARMAGSDEQRRFSIRDQINQLNNETKNYIDVKTQLTYYLENFGQLLTSWQQVSPDKYEIDKGRFGICKEAVSQEASDENFFTSGSCKNGGRTGYSVKLVDGRFLRNSSPNPAQYKLGGKDTSGDLKNKPPDNF